MNKTTQDKRKYDPDCIKNGFEEDKYVCVILLLAAKSMTPSKFKRHSEIK